MPNFPSIYLELQELWRRLRNIEDNGAKPIGPAGGILSGTYPDPEALQTIGGELNIYTEPTSVTSYNNGVYPAAIIKNNRKNLSDDYRSLYIKGFDINDVGDPLAGAAGGVGLQGGKNSINNGDGGQVNIYGGYGKQDGGKVVIISGFGEDNNGGDIEIYCGTGNNKGGNVTVSAGSGDTGGDIDITSGLALTDDLYNGNIVLKTGTSDTNHQSKIKIFGLDKQTNGASDDSGNIEIKAADAIEFGSDVIIKSGRCTNGTGVNGDITLEAGSAADYAIGGDIYLTAGSSSNGVGGCIYIKSGIGFNSNGIVDIQGDIENNTNKGIVLNDVDRPLITRGFDKFTSGDYEDSGRWGLFQENSTIAIGMPDSETNGLSKFRVLSYNADSTINKDLLTLSGSGELFIGGNTIKFHGPGYNLDTYWKIESTTTVAGGDNEAYRLNFYALDRYFDTGFWFSQTRLVGYISNTSTSYQMNDFTGQHRTKILNDIVNSENILNYVGLIVSSNGTYIDQMDPESTNDNITINESLPFVELSNKRNDKKVFGVISNVEDENNNKREYSNGAFVSVFDKKENDHRLFINSVGEGAIWVCNINGNLENGDYITSCEIPGYGMKQDDDLLHNYTVAKITCDCDFNLSSSVYKCEEFEFSGSTYRKAFVGCTYHCG